MAFDAKAYAREYQRKLRAERREKGLCAVCEKPSPDTARCADCRKKDADSQKNRQQLLAAHGLCKMCGKVPSSDGHLYCDACLVKANRSTRKHAAKRKSEGRCNSCGKPCDSFRCEECNRKSNGLISAARKNRVESGKCRDCGEDAITTNRSLRGKERSQYCRDCYLKMLARMTLGSGKKWEVLLDKLEACNWTCPYTGDRLILGDNLSFDHKNPVCRFPEQKGDPDNIEPCTWQINLMKRDLTKEEFLAMIEQIARNLKLRVT